MSRHTRSVHGQPILAEVLSHLWISGVTQQRPLLIRHLSAGACWQHALYQSCFGPLLVGTCWQPYIFASSRRYTAFSSHKDQEAPSNLVSLATVLTTNSFSPFLGRNLLATGKCSNSPVRALRSFSPLLGGNLLATTQIFGRVPSFITIFQSPPAGSNLCS